MASSAEELIAAIGFKPGHDHAGRHLDAFEYFSRSRINAAHIAFVAINKRLSLDLSQATSTESGRVIVCYR